jgi:ribosomal-protein-alanine N-acetyltransferase
MNATDFPAEDPALPVWSVLETERLRLRRIQLTDADGIFALYADPQVRKFTNRQPLRSHLEADKYLMRNRAWQADSRWGIALKSSDALIGTCEYHHAIPAYASTLVGFELVSAYWGNGYMQEALQALLQFGFTQKGYHRIEARTDLRNQRACATLRRLGFQEEGVLRQAGYWHGAFHDCQLFSLLKTERETPNTVTTPPPKI